VLEISQQSRLRHHIPDAHAACRPVCGSRCGGSGGDSRGSFLHVHITMWSVTLHFIMAISEYPKDSVPTDFDGLLLGLNNGDLSALKAAIRDWGFKDTASFLKFVLAVMLQAKDTKGLYIEEDGQKTKVTPSEGLLK